MGKKSPLYMIFLYTAANDLNNVKDPSNVELAKITNNNEIEVVISSLTPCGNETSGKVGRWKTKNAHYYFQGIFKKNIISGNALWQLSERDGGVARGKKNSTFC